MFYNYIPLVGRMVNRGMCFERGMRLLLGAGVGDGKTLRTDQNRSNRAKVMQVKQEPIRKGRLRGPVVVTFPQWNPERVKFISLIWDL